MNLSRRQFDMALLSGVLGARVAHARQRQQPQTPPEVSWLSKVQIAPAQLPADAPRLGSLLVDSRSKPIATREQWNRRRVELSELWLKYLGLWSTVRHPPTFETLASERTHGVARRLIRYESEPGVMVEAYLLMPSNVRGRVPGVVVFHSTVPYTIREGAGLEGPKEAAWGLKLAQRGYVALCPRCFLWDAKIPPDYAERAAAHQRFHPGSRGMAKMFFDAQRALDLLASLPEVDPQRLGAAGHSLGAKEALYLAAFDDRVRVTVCHEGGIGSKSSNWDVSWFLGERPAQREHHELLGLIAPRAFLLMAGNSADGDRSWPFIERALEVYRLYGQPCRIGMFNHGQGHSIPPIAETRAYEWLQAYL